MSRSPYPTYPPHHPHHGRPFLEVHPHDILCGRGVNIASHPGNERFRALVQTRYDDNYCTAYTTSEKRAVAEEILRHIKSLDPPGRFLKRMGRAPSSRGLNGPWEELTDREAIKKTCQALRDCNRSDRSGYASQVSMPDDVRQHAQSRSSTGLSNKQQAAIAAAQKTRAEAGAAVGTPVGSHPHPGSTPSQQQQPIHPMPHPGQHAVPHAGHHHPHHPMMAVASTPEGAVLIPYPPGGMHGAVPIQMAVPPMHPHMHTMPARPDMNNGSQGFSPGPMPLHPPPPQHQSLHAYPPPPHHSHGHHHQQQQHSESPSDQALGQQSHESQDQQPGQQTQAHQQQLQQAHQQAQQQRLQLQPLRHPGEGSLKRPNSSMGSKSDSDSSPSNSQSGEWHKKQRTDDLNSNCTGHATPSNANCGFLGDGLLAGYDIGVSTRTPSQETAKTSGTTPTTAATSAGRSHASNRTSLSSAALPPSPTLAYDPHNLLPVASNAAFYAHHDFMSPPTPMHGDNSFMYHHNHDHHPVVSSNPSAEQKHSYHNGNSTLDEQQLQAAAEAAAAAMAAGDAHNGNGYNSSSPGHFSSEDDAHSLAL